MLMETAYFVPDQSADSDRDDQAQMQAGRGPSFVFSGMANGLSVSPAAIALANFAGVD